MSRRKLVLACLLVTLGLTVIPQALYSLKVNDLANTWLTLRATAALRLELEALQHDPQSTCQGAVRAELLQAGSTPMVVVTPQPPCEPVSVPWSDVAAAAALSAGVQLTADRDLAMEPSLPLPGAPLTAPVWVHQDTWHSDVSGVSAPALWRWMAPRWSLPQAPAMIMMLPGVGLFLWIVVSVGPGLHRPDSIRPSS